MNAEECTEPLVRHPFHGEDCERLRPCPVHDSTNIGKAMRDNRMEKLRAADRYENAGRDMVRLDKEYIVLERRKREETR